MKSDEVVGCEPLGYVGYYSRRTVYDWPGLGSRAVTNYSRTHPAERTMNAMFAHLRPDYLLLRPWEYDAFRNEQKDAAVLYTVVKIFEVDAGPDLWLRDQYDAKYFLLKRGSS